MNWFLTGALTLGTEQETGFWQTVWAWLYEAYFGDAYSYEHLDMGTGTMLSVRLIVVGICLGLSVGGFVAVFNKRVLGGFVRRLLRAECLSPETGKTLPELDYADKLTIRRAVRTNVNLRRVVKCREEEAYEAEEGSATDKKARKKPFRIDPDEHHFYIPEDMKYMADVKFEDKGTTWRGAIVCAILMVILALVLLAVLPYLFSLINDFVGMLKG